jgi:hypothetical protein
MPATGIWEHAFGWPSQPIQDWLRWKECVLADSHSRGRAGTPGAPLFVLLMLLARLMVVVGASIGVGIALWAASPAESTLREYYGLQRPIADHRLTEERI